MALSGLDIYKLLPKTNCRECGFVTCLAFAMQLAKKATSPDKCPYLSEGARQVLEASSLPPIKLVSIGIGDNKVDVGNETVLFRHEEKFHHQAAIGFILDDSLEEGVIRQRLTAINKMKLERIGQLLEVNLVAIRQNASKEKYLKTVQLVSRNTNLGLVLISKDAAALKQAIQITKEKRPLIYYTGQDGRLDIAQLAGEFKLPFAVCGQDLESLCGLTAELNKQGLTELILDTGIKPVKDKLWDLVQIRRQALKKSNRALGYPVAALTDKDNPYDEAIEAATYLCKYAGIILLKTIESWQILSLLVLRQNIYTDPQRPLQIEPKLYPIGNVTNKSHVLVTTNFSLTYYTVLGEVEASKIPAYILSVDTEGMSVLTAWAAEKFTPEKIVSSMDKFSVREAVSHKKLIIPGYVAVISADLEDKSGWQVIVGPKEAAGIPSFLKNLYSAA